MFMVRYGGRSLGLLGKARFPVTRRLSIHASPYFQVPVLVLVRPIIILQSIFSITIVPVMENFLVSPVEGDSGTLHVFHICLE